MTTDSTETAMPEPMTPERLAQIRERKQGGARQC